MGTASKTKKVTARKGKGMMTCSQDQCFWSNHGPIACNLNELLHIVENETNDAQFGYHVNPDRNDYAVWVREVIHDKACATALNKAKKRETFLKALKAAVKKYS